MIKLYHGHVIDILRGGQIPKESVHCVVTSPPYYGLRDYDLPPQIWGGDLDCSHDFDTPGGGGLLHENRNFKRGTQDEVSGTGPLVKVKEEARKGSYFCSKCGTWFGHLGLEPDYRLYVEHLIEVFRLVRQVFRPEGVVFLNLGDSYVGSWGNYAPKSDADWHHSRFVRRAFDDRSWRPPSSYKQGNLKSKDLMGIPWRVALALQEDGWWLRSEIIWHKPNPMPESPKDRPTRDHETIFLLAKSRRYYIDDVAVREPCAGSHHNGERKEFKGNDRKGRKSVQAGNNGETRHWRTVWNQTTQSTPEAHFATFPEALAQRCIKAGTSEYGVCRTCGKPWKRDSKGVGGAVGKSWHDHKDNLKLGNRAIQSAKGKLQDNYRRVVSDWRPTCKCGDDSLVIPATVLDPFVGSGTTCRAAINLNRRAIGIDLGEDYIKMARDKTHNIFASAEY